jgi:hypothetical protein
VESVVEVTECVEEVNVVDSGRGYNFGEGRRGSGVGCRRKIYAPGCAEMGRLKDKVRWSVKFTIVRATGKTIELE